MSHLIESPIGQNQQITEQSDDDFILSVTLADSKDLRFWLMAQSPYISILEPLALKSEIRDLLEQSIKRF